MVQQGQELTPEEKRLLDEYPRPDWLRPKLRWQSLNGPWRFAFDDLDEGMGNEWHHDGIPPEHVKEIQVPYVFQSKASGINDRGTHEVIWYERQINDLRHQGQRSRGDRLLLRFGAVDYECKIWVDGIKVGGHRGGHTPFEVDITDCWTENDRSEKKLVIRVFDSAYDLMQPRGKQYWKPDPESIWYTPSSGIWQSVWLEVVPRIRIGDSSSGTTFCSNDIETGKMKATISVMGRRRDRKFVAVEISAKFKAAVISWTEQKELSKESDEVHIELNLRIEEKILQQRFDEILGRERDRTDATWNHKLADDVALFEEVDIKGLNKSGPRNIKEIPGWRNGLALWSPENPNLYELTIRLYADEEGKIDEVRTWIGVRSLDWTSGDGTFRINGEPYFQSLVLDQGYWPETLMTPPDRTALKDDIVLAKQMGFNGCRKHQKVEDPIFLHYADKLGYLVWGEMANAYDFDQRYVERFDQEWKEVVRRDLNHASIVTWTPINESWGYTDLPGCETQRNHVKSLYYMTKTIDSTRPINDNCGWEHVLTDLSTFHDYADGPVLAETCKTLAGCLSPKSNRVVFTGDCAHKTGAPVLCTEFGGVSITPFEEKARSGAKVKDWGYTTAADPADLLKRLEMLIMAVSEGGVCCGFVYTQLTDIEQERNGLYTWDRRPKLKAEDVKRVIDRAKWWFYELEMRI
ncbi:uncharacterized protein PV09_09790 [Verruconis gallopava]|uniref:Glycoside hydrolase family 2 protein n=1 Tax=Verruconis gallopava TaxID=253628 RepID=A0A0D2AHG1_9PEZI|nr:uncharacterized protein PV09_09790 [Verruconis gallopava]KIV98378.1 hypothetical protein PV09_09790 [Verruconis gallopava]